MFHSSNPILTSDTFQSGEAWEGHLEHQATRTKVMTIRGAVNASFILLGICGAAAIATWSALQSNPALFWPAFIATTLGGLVLSLIAVFKPRTAPIVAPMFAATEGIWVAVASLVYASWASNSSNGIVTAAGTTIIFQAGILTLCIALGMLTAYATRLIKPHAWLINSIMAAAIGVCIFFAGAWLVAMFTSFSMMSLYSGPLGIALSAIVVVVAAAMLIVDFYAIERGAQRQLPKHYEWLAALGLLVTLVWLYVSLLRLLAILNRE